MLTQERNLKISLTGPGTPAGELFRRYWQPVALSREVRPGGKPSAVRILGEELVLFRDDQGRPGLLGLHCSHRLTSLAYGRVEDGGIRCPFHGWLYDVAGRCLEQPAEPEGSTLNDRIRHPSYPCRDLGGLVFAYLGPPDRMPLLPRYEVLVRDDGTRNTSFYRINSNYLQNLEGAVDTVHFSYLHMDHWSQVKHKLAAMPKARLEFVETDYGIWQKSLLPNVQLGTADLVYTYFFMPAGFLRVQESSRGGGDIKKFQSWYVPVDDTHMLRFQAAFAPLGTHGEPYQWESDEGFIEPGPHNDYFRDYEHTDTICGIPTRTAASGVKGFLAQDSMVNESQGPIADWSGEHLSAQDQVLLATRLMLLTAIEDVQQGRDPKHIILDPSQNDIVYIRGAEELEHV